MNFARSIAVAALSVAFLTTTPAHAAVQCGGAPWLAHASLENQTAEGGKDYLKAITADFFLRLTPTEFGWEAMIADGINQDLSVLTPPIRIDTNPRRIEGWHFRNAANTGQNTGDVNAPQLVRQFIFSPNAPELYRTYGHMVPDDEIAKVTRFGRGTLTIKSYALADTRPGKTAKMTKMNFDFCLEWAATIPQPTAPVGELEPPAVPPHIVTAVEACGLPKTHKIEPYIAPSYYEPDFNGDAQTELTFLVTRIKDNKRGIVVCWTLPAKRLDLVGFEGRMDELVPEYFDRMTDWMLQTERNPGQSAEQPAPPKLTGDSILLAKDDSSSALLYWDDAKQRFWSYWQGD